MPIQPIEASKESLTKIVDRRLVLWIGAGLSIGAGYPSTWKIVEALAAAADDPIDTGRSFYEVVDAVVASVGKGCVGDELQGLFQPARPTTPTHRAIARLAKAGRIDNILTTNYDDLLERALVAEGAPCVLQPLDRNDFVTGEGVRLMKVHGSYDDWRSVVLSGRSYAQFGKQYPFLRSQMDVLLRQRPVLFAGCSLQDPRILDWIGELPDRAAEELKEWRAIVTEAEWRAALGHVHGGVRAEEIFARTPLRPVIVRDHDHARSLWVDVANAVPRAADIVALDLTVKGEALSAEVAGAGSWTPENPLLDEAFVDRLRTLRELDHQPLPTDDRGTLAPAAAGTAAALRALAEEVGRAVTGMLAPAAQRKLAESVGASLDGEPPLLHVRVNAGTSVDERRLADRLLALPWELVVVDGAFPVERGKLDVAREAVVSGAAGLGAPDRELSVVAAVSAPVDASRLDHEGECYRLWRAMGSEERRLHLTDTGSLQALYEAMERVKPAVLHFTGHGEPGALLFEDDEAHSVKVRVGALVDGLRRWGLPRLAFLASCHGASAARRDAIDRAGRASSGTKGDAERGEEPVSVRLVDPALLIAEDPIWSSAAELHREGIHQVVAWFGPVGDRQCTRAEEVFYAALVKGKTARQAVREARQACRQPLRSQQGKATAVYPLGWAQMALYHRGADEPTALPGTTRPAPKGDKVPVPVRVDTSRGPVGVERLTFGFVGRRSARADLLRRVHEGDRLLVIHGLGGLGKTALAAWLAPVVARKIAPWSRGGEPAALPVIALDGRFAGQSADPVPELWDQVSAALPRWKPEDKAWAERCGAELAARQKDGIGAASVVGVLGWLAAQAGGLVVYLDDAESLQEPVAPGAEIGLWRDAELSALWDGLVGLAAPAGTVAVLASTRFVPEGLPAGAAVPLPVMARIDLVHLLSWWSVLGGLGPEDTAWLVERLDGHPRSVAWLESLAAEKVARLAAPGGRFQGDLRREVLEPLLPSLDAKLDADLLLPQLLAVLGPAVQGFVRRLGVLARPAPWEALLALEEIEGTAQRAQKAGLVSPFESGAREAGWAPHRMVLAKAGALSAAEARGAHGKLGGWFRAQWEEQEGDLGLARDAAHHLCEAGEGMAAWGPALRVVLALRGAGRFREALPWVRRLLAANPAGAERGRALTLDVQIGLLAGDLPLQAEAQLREAEGLVDVVDRSFVLDELGKLHQQRGELGKAAEVLKASVDAAIAAHGTDEHPSVAASLHALAAVLHVQGDLVGAQAHLERSLRIWANAWGTDEHPSVAASLAVLAGVLRAKGDLGGARAHLERSLRIQAKVLGTEEHPSVAASLHELAQVLHAQGDLGGARAHLERSLRISAKVFGTEEHPDVATSLHALAGVLKEQGDLGGARAHLERSLRICANVFGTEEHPSVATSLHELAGVLKAEGDLVGARAHLERSLRICANVFGTEEHPSVAASRHALAGVLKAQGDVGGARAHYEQVLGIQERLYGGREHYVTAITETNLGILLAEMGEPQSAKPLLRHAYQVFLRSLGPEHPYTKDLAQLLEGDP